ncbi:MAG: hypothetical protein NTU58_02565 [Candidatus Nealsonbacteria bacterium]|nr:hypothetical protein [Candidatus Nealsonbacteria bacterium]
MLEELKQTKNQLEQIKETVGKANFFEIEKLDIRGNKDPIEIEKSIEVFFEIMALSTDLKKFFTSIQYKVIDKRIEGEKRLESLNKKALQIEELVFLF